MGHGGSASRTGVRAAPAIVTTMTNFFNRQVAKDAKVTASRPPFDRQVAKEQADAAARRPHH